MILCLMQKFVSMEGSVVTREDLQLAAVLQVCSIGVASITQVMHMYTKNSNIQGRSANVVKVIFLTIRNCS